MKYKGSLTTTPRTAELIRFLGPGIITGSVGLTTDEFRAVNKLYGFKREEPTPKPPAPETPDPEAFASPFEYEEAFREYKRAVEAYERWEDPRPLMQAGADRNAIRRAEVDGLRMLAWLAKFVPPGEDPLKTLVQLAVDAGWDVDPSDVRWAEAGEEVSDES